MNALTAAKLGLGTVTHFYGHFEALLKDYEIQPWPAQMNYNDEYYLDADFTSDISKLKEGLEHFANAATSQNEVSHAAREAELALESADAGQVLVGKKTRDRQGAREGRGPRESRKAPHEPDL